MKKRMTDEELLRLAKIGVIALVDEATGYQKERRPGELGKICDELKGKTRRSK